MKYKKLLVIAIFILGAILRFYKLGQVPAGFNWDEASIGYNAYSILKTGKDEFNRFLPVSFQSYNDYKMPLYVYLTVPSILLFGLTEFSVRFISALFGTLCIFVFYLLTGEILKSLKKNTLDIVQLVAMAFMAISPWHLQFSRVAFEPNLSFFWIILGTYLFFKSRSRPFLLVFSGISFVFSIDSYHSALVFSPLIFLLLFCLFYKQIIKRKKYLVLTFTVGLLLLFPLLKFILMPQGLTRFKGTSVLNEVDIGFLSIEKINQDKNNPFMPQILSKEIHNRRIYFARKIIDGYLSHYSLNFLFLPSAADKHKAPQVGYFYLAWLPLLFLGFYKVFDLKLSKKIIIFMFAYFLLAAVPAAPTVETPHAVRTFNLLPPLIWFIAIGLGVLVGKAAVSKKIKYILWLFCLATFINFCFYLHMYYVHMPKEHSHHWQYGYKELVNYLNEQDKNFDNIVFYPKGGTLLNKAHGFVLFFSKYDPITYQDEGGTKLCHFGFSGRYNFGKYYFRTIKCFAEEPLINVSDDYLSFGDKTAFIANPEDVPSGAKIIKQVNDFYDKPVLVVFSKNE
jgi:4-amino-4-deoxy-L-arabinose transferase-like glycosyltransferase